MSNFEILCLVFLLLISGLLWEIRDVLKDQTDLLGKIATYTNKDRDY